jgi:site-specific recombinase XerD
MALRIRSGRWHYWFEVNAQEWAGTTGLAGTERNWAKAAAIEARALAAAEDQGQPPARRVVISFSEAAQEFLRWADAEDRAHPATTRRLKGSLSTLTAYFGERQLSAITAGEIEGYKTWRRTEHEVAEVTLRRDLDALRPMLRSARKHDWLASDPMVDVSAPSDTEAIRFHLIWPHDELLYFQTCLRLGQLALHDLGKIMLLQGARPSEVLAACGADVDLITGSWTILRSKSNAGRRTLHLVAECRSILAAREIGRASCRERV